MSALAGLRSAQRQAPWIAAGVAGLVVSTLWVAARPEADPCGTLGASPPAASALSKPAGPDRSASGPPAREIGWVPGPRAAGRELLARRLAAERDARAQRQELLDRRRHALGSPGPRSAPDRRMRQSFEEEIQQLTERAVRDLRERPGRP